MDPAAFEKCKSIVDLLSTSNKPWPIIAKSVHYNGESRYTEEQKNYFSKTVKRMPDMDWYNRVNKNGVWKRKIWVNSADGVSEVPSNNWFTLNKLNYFKGWTCNLGIDHIEIYQDGTISGNCRQKIWGLDYYHNLYNSNFKDKFNPNFIPTTCQQQICHCTSEIIINKHA
jgi:hypothetical protein